MWARRNSQGALKTFKEVKGESIGGIVGKRDEVEGRGNIELKLVNDLVDRRRILAESSCEHLLGPICAQQSRDGLFSYRD